MIYFKLITDNILMSRHLNLRLPTLSECIVNTSFAEDSKESPQGRLFRSTHSLKNIRESLDKTSEKLDQLQRESSLPIRREENSKRSYEAMREEIIFLRKEIRKLEREK